MAMPTVLIRHIIGIERQPITEQTQDSLPTTERQNAIRMGPDPSGKLHLRYKLLAWMIS